MFQILSSAAMRARISAWLNGLIDKFVLAPDTAARSFVTFVTITTKNNWKNSESLAAQSFDCF